MAEKCAAEIWEATLGTVRRLPGVNPDAILAQTIKGLRPDPVGIDGRRWKFDDGSSLIVNSSGVLAIGFPVARS